MRKHAQLEAVIFDWSGTVVDHGAKAPADVFVRAFAAFEVALTEAEAREPMGMAERAHIEALMDLPRVRAAWREQHGRDPEDADIDRVHAAFVPMTVDVVADHGELIDGAAAIARRLRERGLALGSTTGYSREIMAPLLPKAAAQGFTPDNLVCAGDVAHGRPAPLMLYRSLVELGVWPTSSVVVVDDTPAGIRAGLEAGCWTVGVALTGNAFGLTPAEAAALDEAERAWREAKAYAELARAGAHAVIDGVGELESVVDEIEGALARGERP
jgi:phosphonoacetaldehyde hydrolase